MSNPATISPNTGRKFEVNARYWLRASDNYVMPRTNSRYEQPDGFIAVVAISETELARDTQPLDAVPRDIDPTNPHHVGAAVSAEGVYRMEERQPQVQRPMPVTMPRALDDHIVQERSNAALAAAAALASGTPLETSGDDVANSTAPKRTPRANRH